MAAGFLKHIIFVVLVMLLLEHDYVTKMNWQSNKNKLETIKEFVVVVLVFISVSKGDGVYNGLYLVYFSFVDSN